MCICVGHWFENRCNVCVFIDSMLVKTLFNSRVSVCESGCIRCVWFLLSRLSMNCSSQCVWCTVQCFVSSLMPRRYWLSCCNSMLPSAFGCNWCHVPPHGWTLHMLELFNLQRRVWTLHNSVDGHCMDVSPHGWTLHKSVDGHLVHACNCESWGLDATFINKLNLETVPLSRASTTLPWSHWICCAMCHKLLILLLRRCLM